MPEDRSVFAKTKDGQLWHAVMKPQMTYDYTQFEHVSASSWLSRPAYDGPKRTGYVYDLDSYQTLASYEKDVWKERQDEIEDLKSDEELGKYLELAASVLGAASMFLPFLRLGQLTVYVIECCTTAASFATSLAQTQLYSDPTYVRLDLTEKSVNAVFKLLEGFSPVGSRIAAWATGSAFYIGGTMATSSTYAPPGCVSSSTVVAADLKLNEILRFRRMFDPGFAEFEKSANRILEKLVPTKKQEEARFDAAGKLVPAVSTLPIPQVK
jgi:hypothetical protein